MHRCNLVKNNIHILCFSAYHGHLTSLIDISPYKLNLPGAPKKPDHVHVVCIKKNIS